MSARIPSRQAAVAVCRPRTTHWMPCASLSTSALRARPAAPGTAVTTKPAKGLKSAGPPVPDIAPELRNPILDDYLAKKRLKSTQEQSKAAAPRPAIREGGLPKDPSSLFSLRRTVPGWHEGMTPEERKRIRLQMTKEERAAKEIEERQLVSMTVDPDPRARLRLERKLVIDGVKRHGRLTKAEKIQRTERQSLYQSKFLPTSVKKMQKVINHIAGKSVSDALVQLRFSPKKVARDIIKGLEIAQNEAIVGRGMNLEGGDAALARWQAQRAKTDVDRSSSLFTSDSKDTPEKKTQHKRTCIELKDGTKKVVRDPSELYIDQAWVNRGQSWNTPEFRARGMINMLIHRTTSFSVLLKEEKTRMRISDEIKKKRDNRKLWVALPDRPVTSQRQYCLW